MSMGRCVFRRLDCQHALFDRAKTNNPNTQEIQKIQHNRELLRRTSASGYLLSWQKLTPSANTSGGRLTAQLPQLQDIGQSDMKCTKAVRCIVYAMFCFFQTSSKNIEVNVFFSSQNIAETSHRWAKSAMFYKMFLGFRKSTQRD